MSDNKTVAIPEAVQTKFDDADGYAASLIGRRQIMTPEGYEESGAVLVELAARVKALDSERLKITRPMDDAKKRIMELFRRPLDRLSAARSHIEKLRAQFRAEQRAKEIEAQRKAEAEAERERAKLERRAERAAAAGKDEKAVELEAQAASVVAPVITAPTPKTAGVSVRGVAKFEIVDPEKLPRAYLKPDEVKIGKIVRAMRLDTDIPGVRVWLDEKESVRA